MRAKIIVSAFVLALSLAGSAAVLAIGSGSDSTRGFDRRNSDLDPVTAEDFRDFPLYSVGDSFEGLPLTAITRRLDPVSAGERPADYVSFLYGDCVAASEEGCALPLEVQIWPACARSLSDYSLSPDGTPLPHEPLSVRGVPAALFEGGLRLELYTGELTVVVFGLERARVLRAAEMLRGVNVPASAGERLPAPAVGAMEGKLQCGSS